MASAMVGIRFVRCPKCDKVLAEFGQVPVYRCGGCGTVLRAKTRASTAETTTVRGSLEKDSQNPTTESSSSTSFVNQSASSANQADTSSEVGNGMQRVAQSDHRHLHRVLDSNGNEELVQKGKDTTNERRYEDSSPGVIAENLPERGNQVREMENSLQDLHNLSLDERKEKSTCRVDNDAGFLEDDTKFTSTAYDASDSSRDEQPLSRRRFRHEKASSSSSSKDGSTEKSTQPQTQDTPTESYAARRRRSLERDTTFGSDDFHSVQNWMGSEIDDEDLVTLSKDLLFRSSANPPTKAGYSEPDPMKILRKVDELRDELREFLTRTPEGKPRVTQCPPRVPKVPIQDGVSEKLRKAKKKTQTIKQYLRPVCGGAPFVICYKCWTLLQLPADFLVSGKTLHRLQCGACSETLVFSFRPRARTDPPPRTPTEARHPPSEVDPVSPSKSYSSSELNESMQNVSRSSSYSARRQRANGSRLHLLMGYNSASDVLFQREGDGGNNSSATSTPQFYRPPRDRRYRHYGVTGTSTPNSPEIQEVEEPSQSERSITPRRRGSAALGLLKKGVREFSHGLENVKLKVHSRGG